MRKIPRLIISITIAVIFWIGSMVVPPLFGGVNVPGINVSGSFFIWGGLMLITAIFVIRALADALSIADVLTDFLMRHLGAKEDRSLKRVGRDAIYIIIIILLAEASIPFLSSVPEVGNMLRGTVSLVAFGLIILLVYDIGRIFYRTMEKKADALADLLAKRANQKQRKKGN